MRVVEHLVSDVTLEHDRVRFNNLTPLMFEDIKRFKASSNEPVLIIELFDENEIVGISEIVGIFIFDSFESTITATSMLNKYINQWRTSLN